VLGSGAAIVLAIYTGLRATLLFGGGLYLVALIVILGTANGSQIPVPSFHPRKVNAGPDIADDR